ncbi:hypothetical protein [Microbacterium dauci]|uniref:Phosphatidate cytidylyltransferase n=1 Tax=Microbacterium dauci TaxID=3048008 RepID=A0ABT6ZDE4_9MICO|nr:hypothetical protein [Microbacterium sp. LX3-4]MDJ1114001.1 hypothetical protein [Microbacterium sp. LX3-4]
MSTPAPASPTASSKMFGALAAVVIAIPLCFFAVTVAVAVMLCLVAVILVVQGWLLRREESSGGFRLWMLLLPLVPAVLIIALRGYEGAVQLIGFFGVVA